MHYHLMMAGRAVARPRPLPPLLVAARALVFDPLTCLDLNLTARRVLFGILSFVQARTPTREIFPRRDTLRAEAHLQSDSTLYRGLALLEKKGYITREQTRKRRNGTFYLSPIYLTQKAIVLLELDGVVHRAPSSNMTDGHTKERTTKKQSYQSTAGDRGSAKDDGYDKVEKLPRELVPLLDRGLRHSVVRMLMNQAKVAGKRLGDVVRALAGAVEKRRGNELIGFLSAMIRRKVDYAYLARQAQEEAQSIALNEQAKRALEQLDNRLNGFEVLRHDGAILGVFEAAAGPGQLAHVHSRCGSTPVNLRFAIAFVKGDVRLVRPTSWEAQGSAGCL